MYNIEQMTSSDINDLLEEINTSLSNVYSDIIERASDIENLELVAELENKILYSKIAELENKLDEIKNRQWQSQNENIQIFSMTLDSRVKQETAKIEPSYNLATIPYSQSFTLNLAKFNKNLLLKNTRIEVSIEDQDGAHIDTITLYEDLSLINIFDSNDMKVWIDERVVSATKLVYNIKVYPPKKLLPTNILNTIAIKPFPAYQLNLKDVSINGSAGNTKILKEEQNQIGNIKINFINMANDSVNIQLEQSNYEKVGDKNKFMTGLRSIDLGYQTPLANTPSYLVLELEPKNANYYLHMVEPPIIISPNNMEECITCELYSDSTLMNQFQFNKAISGNFTKLYIKVLMSPISSNLPLLKQVSVKYKTR